MKNAKGSFEDLTKYKTNLIPLYSLFRKDSAYVSKKLGTSIASKLDEEEGIKKTYKTQNGTYVINFKQGLSNAIEMYPNKEIEYLGSLFMIDRAPFEVVDCKCGLYTSEVYEASGEDPGDHSYGSINTFQDKTQHLINLNKKAEH